MDRRRTANTARAGSYRTFMLVILRALRPVEMSSAGKSPTAGPFAGLRGEPAYRRRGLAVSGGFRRQKLPDLRRRGAQRGACRPDDECVFLALSVEAERVVGKEFTRLRRSGPWLTAGRGRSRRSGAITAKFACCRDRSSRRRKRCSKSSPTIIPASATALHRCAFWPAGYTDWRRGRFRRGSRTGQRRAGRLLGASR